MLHSNGNHTGSKEGHAKVADNLLVVGAGHVWVVQAMDFDLDHKRLAEVFQCLWILALVIKH